MSAGKGSKPRPINKKLFDEQFSEINWQKPISWKEKTTTKNSKLGRVTRFVY